MVYANAIQVGEENTVKLQGALVVVVTVVITENVTVEPILVSVKTVGQELDVKYQTAQGIQTATIEVRFFIFFM